MRGKETAIEVKVGGLVLLAIGVFIAFIMVLGDCNFSPGFHVSVDFNNAAGLKPGAPVRLAGIPAGSVKSVRFMGGEMEEVGEGVERPVYVRATLFIEDEIRESIRSDATFTITTQGVLGEPYVEITSTDRTAPPIEDGQIFLGTDPPRLDQLLASGYDILEGVRELVDRLNRRGENPIRIDDFVNNIADAAGELTDRVVENREEIDNIFTNVDAIVAEIETNKETIPNILRNVESATGEFDALGRSLNNGVGSGREIRSILTNVDDATEVIAREAEPTMVSIRGAADSADRILSENEEQIASTIDNAEVISQDLASASGDVRTIIRRIEQGEGSIGRLLRDEEIFEDMREFVRELKRRPWRIIWKE